MFSSHRNGSTHWLDRFRHLSAAVNSQLHPQSHHPKIQPLSQASAPTPCNHTYTLTTPCSRLPAGLTSSVTTSHSPAWFMRSSLLTGQHLISTSRMLTCFSFQRWWVDHTLKVRLSQIEKCFHILSTWLEVFCSPLCFLETIYIFLSFNISFYCFIRPRC